VASTNRFSKETFEIYVVCLERNKLFIISTFVLKKLWPGIVYRGKNYFWQQNNMSVMNIIGEH
jgi:hypothetical protein